MDPLEFYGLNGYVYASFGVQIIKNFGWITRFSKKQPLCWTSTLIHIKEFIKPQIITNNGILVSCSIVGTSFFSTIVDNLWFWG
jgi:hypothetical protein